MGMSEIDRLQQQLAKRTRALTLWQECGNRIMEVVTGKPGPLSDSDVIACVSGLRQQLQPAGNIPELVARVLREVAPFHGCGRSIYNEACLQVIVAILKPVKGTGTAYIGDPDLKTKLGSDQPVYDILRQVAAELGLTITITTPFSQKDRP